MHVAFNGWFWDQPHTGSGQYLRRLLAALRRLDAGLQLTLVVPPHNPQPNELPPDVTVSVTRSLFGLRGNLAKVWFEQRAYPAAVARVRADLAHVPYWGTPLASPAPLVTTVLDVIPLALPEYAAGFLPSLYTSLVRASAPGSARVITISEAAKADIVERLHIPAPQIAVTYLAADERYHPRIGAEGDPAVRKKYDLPDRFILYLGGFDRRKQLEQLLLAYTYVVQAEGDDVPLVLAGREPAWGEPLFPDLRAYAERLNIAHNICWIGYVDEADKPALYRLATVFAYPSRYEGFGLPVLEALASGTPVVANEISSIPEVAGEGAYLVADGDARKMAGALIALIEQDDFRSALIGQGLAQATRFSWRKTARETLAVYEQVLSS